MIPLSVASASADTKNVSISNSNSQIEINVNNKYFEYNGSIKNLKFVETIALSVPTASTNSANVIKNEKNYDTYVDEHINTYYFFKDTDTICGFQKENYYSEYTPITKAINEIEAKNVAENYLKNVIPEFNDYKQIFCQYSEFDAVYQMQYSFLLDNIATDDIINIYIQANGDVGAFMMLNRSAYRNLVIDYNCIKEAMQKNVESFINQYISINNDGLVLIRTYEFRSESGESKIKQFASQIK
jgi:hypothetical protein